MKFLSNSLVFITFFVVPFLGGNHLPLFYISIDRFWIEGIFSFALILSILFQYLAKQNNIHNFSKFLIFFLPFAIITVLSITYSWNKFNTVQSICVLTYVTSVVYLYSLCPDKNVCLIALVAGAAAISIAAIFQHIFLFPQLTATFQQGLYAQVLREQFGIPFGSYMYHNMLGGYLAFIFPISLYYATFKKNPIYIISSALIITGVVLTASRISLGIIVLALLVSLLIYIWKRNKWVFVRFLLVIITACSLSWIIIYSGSTAKDSGVQKIIVEKAKTARTQLSTINTRTEIWKNALNAFQNKPLLGFGAGAFEYGYRKYFDGNSYTGVAHSTLVKIAVELGIIGLACLLIYLLGVAINIRHALNQTLNQFLLVSAISGLLFSLIDFSFDVNSHLITFFVLTSGFIVSKITQSERIDRKHAGIKAISIFLIMIVLSIFVFFINLRVNIARTSTETGDLFFENGFIMNALRSYREALDAMPLNNEGHIKAMSALLTMYYEDENRGNQTQINNELGEYIKSVSFFNDNDSEVYFIKGRVYAAMGDEKKADTNFKLALFFYPSSGYYIHEIASHYASIGKFDDALMYIRMFDPYIDKHIGPYNPRGIYVYKIRDLEADIRYMTGDSIKASELSRRNFEDAKNNVYVITSSRARNFVSRSDYLQYLKQKEETYSVKYLK